MFGFVIKLLDEEIRQPYIDEAERLRLLHQKVNIKTFSYKLANMGSLVGNFTCCSFSGRIYDWPKLLMVLSDLYLAFLHLDLPDWPGQKGLYGECCSEPNGPITNSDHFSKMVYTPAPRAYCY